jgi:TolB-like protein
VLVVVAAGGGWWAHGAAAGAHVGQPPVRLAVLPFEEVGEAGDPILAVGMAEVLTTRLASVGQLEVVDPRSAARYRASRLSPEEIGVELDVPFLVRGMVRWTREPDGTSTARLTPMLVSTADGGVRWTGKEYRIEPQRPFAVQAAIAREVTDALGVALTRAERQALVRGPTSDPSAYQYYLQGLDRLREWQNHHHGTEPLPEAAALFARAVERDSTFTLACAKLAEARLHEYLLTPHARSRDPRDLKPFRAAYDHAVRLDPNLPETIAVHGLYLLHVVGDTTRAYQELDRASAMRPSDARLLANRIRYPASLRSLDHDVVLLERALRLDPRSPEALTSLVVILNISRRFAEADHFAVRLTDVDPQNFVGYLHGTRAALRARGDTLRARRFITEGMRRATAPARLLPQFHLLGEDFARALDTLTLAGLRKARPNRVDSLTYYEAKLEAALRLGRSASVRVLADSLLQLAAGESSLHMRGLRATPALAALGRSSEAERALRLNEEHSDAQVRSMFAGGDTVAARSIQGRIGYDMARVYARTGNLTKMAVHLGRALTAPNGVTPYSVRLDPAFFRWHGHPALESALRAAPTTHEPRASTAP